MKVTFEFEKETKNTMRFQEVVNENETPVCGTIYVQKSALKEMNYENGNQIEIEIKVK